MKNSNKRKILKNVILVIIGVLLIDGWLLWENREKMLLDYSFITKDKKSIDATIYSIKDIEIEEEVERGYSSKIIQHDGMVYNYKFNFNNKEFIGNDYSFSQNQNTVNDIPFKKEVEFIIDDPSKNRIKGFSFIKSGFDFFKEYFMFKIIVLLVIIGGAFNYYTAEKKKSNL